MVSGTDMAVFSFRCTACGKCCNSPPQMSVPELFRFQHIFIGSLAVRPFGPEPGTAELRDALMFRLPAQGGAHVAILAQGYGYEAMPCPALDDAGLCSLHAVGKPVMCEAVPLDPLLPDAAQHLVLAQRRQDAAFFDALCIVPGNSAAHDRLVDGDAVASAAGSAALGRHRAALAEDRQYWGNAVFADMARAWMQDASAMARIPTGGYLALPMVPVLLALAAWSEASRARCLAYVSAQLALIDTTVLRAVQRKRAEERPMTQRLRAWHAAYRELVPSLTGMRLSGAADAAMEAWLERDPRGSNRPCQPDHAAGPCDDEHLFPGSQDDALAADLVEA